MRARQGYNTILAGILLPAGQLFLIATDATYTPRSSCGRSPWSRGGVERVQHRRGHRAGPGTRAWEDLSPWTRV